MTTRKKMLYKKACEYYMHPCLELGAAKQHYIKNSVKCDIVKGPEIKHVFDCNYDFPFENNSYRMVIAGDLIEHLRYPYCFLYECYRILKKDGVLLISTPNCDRQKSYLCDEHLQFYDIGSFKNLLECNGFKIIEFVGAEINKYYSPYFIEKHFPWLCYYMIAICKIR